jgi:hypothetical protein
MSDDIRFAPINDGRDEDCQCARCGSSAGFIDCYNCHDGYTSHDCGEDCCCCLEPEDNVPCDVCEGRGGWWNCLSSYRLASQRERRMADVLPGNPGSDWTEQDERMMRTYAEISDTELSDWPQSSDMPHRLAREILRLRADAERMDWLEAEHSRVDPVMRLTVKEHHRRESHFWVNVNGARDAIDTARSLLGSPSGTGSAT